VSSCVISAPISQREGIAVWSIGYRRADEPGGGYPGTFNDVAEAIDLLWLPPVVQEVSARLVT